MSHLCILRHRKKLLENFRKFISQERHIRISSKLRHRKKLLENFRKFITQERHFKKIFVRNLLSMYDYSN